jgi:hypothetical protein
VTAVQLGEVWEHPVNVHAASTRLWLVASKADSVYTLVCLETGTRQLCFEGWIDCYGTWRRVA